MSLEVDKGGRPTKYNDDMPDRLIEYFQKPGVLVIGDKEYPKFPTVEGFCASILIAKSTFYEWLKHNVKFSDAFNAAKQIQADSIINHALNKVWSEGYAKLITVNCTDYKDKSESKDEIKHTIGFNYKLD